MDDSTRSSSWSAPRCEEPDDAGDVSDTTSMGVTDAKRELRRSMRRMRRGLVHRPQRSTTVTAHLQALAVVRDASTLLAYDAIPGEVETSAFVSWCHENGIDVAMPEDGVDPTWPDVIVVPGVAFTRRGERLGQGGGWYDRFLPGRRDDAYTIGLGYEAQLLESLPIEPHDVRLDCVVVESGPRFSAEQTPST